MDIEIGHHQSITQDIKVSLTIRDIEIGHYQSISQNIKVSLNIRDIEIGHHQSISQDIKHSDYHGYRDRTSSEYFSGY